MKVTKLKKKKLNVENAFGNVQECGMCIVCCATPLIELSLAAVAIIVPSTDSPQQQV